MWSLGPRYERENVPALRGLTLPEESSTIMCSSGAKHDSAREMLSEGSLCLQIMQIMPWREITIFLRGVSERSFHKKPGFSSDALHDLLGGQEGFINLTFRNEDAFIRNAASSGTSMTIVIVSLVRTFTNKYSLSSY